MHPYPCNDLGPCFYGKCYCFPYVQGDDCSLPVTATCKLNIILKMLKKCHYIYNLGELNSGMLSSCGERGTDILDNLLTDDANVYISAYDQTNPQFYLNAWMQVDSV